MIWGAANADPATIARAKAAGRTLLGFNEPDLAGQAQMSGLYRPDGTRTAAGDAYRTAA
jgi:hypothetical protein